MFVLICNVFFSEFYVTFFIQTEFISCPLRGFGVFNIREFSKRHSIDLQIFKKIYIDKLTSEITH